MSDFIEIISQPTNADACEGAEVVFSIEVESSSEVSYQWMKDGEYISEGTSAILVIFSITESDEGSYICVVSNGSGQEVISSPANLTVKEGAVITTQPQGGTINWGASKTFTIAAAGDDPLTYQWKKNGSNISGATGTTYTINNAKVGDSGNYSCVVGSSCGSVASNNAQLTVVENLSITTQPVNQVVCEGSSATFSIVASGSGISYQWKKNGTNISGATSASLTISNVNDSDEGNYSCVASISSGLTKTSSSASLTAKEAAGITTQPQGGTINWGASKTFTVAATGDAPLTYRWRKNGGNISGATSASYTINNATVEDSGNYSCVVTNSCGSATSNNANLTVVENLSITTQPVNQVVCEGSSAIFSIVASGSGISYQWKKNGTNISGATSASLTISNVNDSDEGNYSCVASISSGLTKTSSSASLTAKEAAGITTQPQGGTINWGASKTFTVAATGDAPLTYQWKKNGGNISGATSASYTINNATVEDSGNYSCVVTNSCGSATSNNANLTVVENLSITTQPVNQVVCSGGSATFSIVASGTDISYQWKKNGVNISGATSASLTISNVDNSDEGNYSCVASISSGLTKTSSSASLTAKEEAEITTQPQGGTINWGASKTLTVEATGDAPLTYQWKKDGSNISGVTSNSLVINNATVEDSGNYSCVVTNSCGSATSNNANLTVVENLSITTQPEDQAVCPGGSATFSIVASGTDISYQWKKNGVNISGATSASLTISNVGDSDEGNYSCVASISSGLTKTSSSASLTAKEEAGITAQPQGGTINWGANKTFTVAAMGDAPLTYQWKKNGGNISGATSASYTISNATVEDSGNYSCVVTNSCGSATSNTAILTIIENPQINNNMSNWSTYLQTISFGFRNVVQTIRDYYTAQDVSYEQFYQKDATSIQVDLESFQVDSPFFLEYANSLKRYANVFPNGEGSFIEMNELMLVEDQNHYNGIISSLQTAYEDFEVFKNVETEQLATQLFNLASSGVDLLDSFATMMIAVKSTDIWDRLVLHFYYVEDKEVQLLVENLRNATGTNINSFRTIENYSAEEFADAIISFGASDSYRNFVAESIILKAKLTYQNFGEGDINAELWDRFINSFPEPKQSAIEYLKGQDAISTVYQLSELEVSAFVNLASIDFFNLYVSSFLTAVAEVAELFSIKYRFIGRLVDDTVDVNPLANWRVSAVDANDLEFGEVLLGNSITNGDGYFDTYFTTYQALSSPYSLDFKITDQETGEEYIQSKSFDPTSPNTPVVFSINVITLSDSALITTVESEDANLTIPATLATYLSNHNLNSLEDIRLFKGLATQVDLPEGTEIVAARIDSHANLEILKGEKLQTEYLKENAGLIDAGYSNIRIISKENRYDFVSNTKNIYAITDENTGQYDAGKVFEQAGSAMSFVTNKLTEGLNNNFKDYENDPDIAAALASLQINSCNCQDCKSGVSPLAYLVDLTNYTLDHLRKITLSENQIPGSGTIIYNRKENIITHEKASSISFTLAELQEEFKHPFAELPANCDSVNKSICQVRVCIEVLWTLIFKFEGAGSPDNVISSNDLSTAQELKDIRLGTYQYLLKEMGTSYEEIRRIKFGSVEEREKFANRIGFAVAHIDEFILNHSSSSDQISDIVLEELFGYRDTTRNYKTVDSGDDLPNALVETPKSKLEKYREDFLREQFHLQDYPGKPYSQINRPFIDPDIVTADDFRNPNISSSHFSLWQKRFNWISGVAAELSDFKRLASTFVKSQRIKVKAPVSVIESLPEITVVDELGNPQILTPISYIHERNNELTVTLSQAPPAALQLSSMVTISGVDYAQGGEVVPDISFEHDAASTKKSIFQRMKEAYTYETDTVNSLIPWEGIPVDDHEEYFELLYGNLKNNQTYEDTINTIWNNFSLKENEFVRLYELFIKNKNSREDDESLKLSPEEWQELINLMVVSIKRKFETIWINEESGLVSDGYFLDPEVFWKSITEPSELPSPFPFEAAYYNIETNVPIVDPDLVNEKDLPDWKVGSAAKVLFGNRLEELTTAKENIRTTRINNDTGSSADNGFSELMDFVFGVDLADEIATTVEDLGSSDIQVSFNAEEKIKNEYHLSIEQFASLVGLKQKAAKTDPAEQPTDEEWNILYADLLIPYKIIKLYPSWKDEEKTGYFDTVPSIPENTTWKLRKATLPKWRGSLDLRSKWLQELEITGRQSIIDPYLITPAYMKNIAVDNRVLQLWDDRKDTLESYRTTILGGLSGANAFINLNTYIEDYLDIEAKFSGSAGNWILESDDLTVLKEMQEAGVNVKGHLTQIGLTIDSFARIFNLRELLMQNPAIELTEVEREEIANILIGIHKSRLFAQWNVQEKNDVGLNENYSFSLSTDFFQQPPIAPIQFPPKQDEVKPMYLFEQKAFQDWKRTLESRERTMKANHEGIQNAISDTEDAFLIPTRDAIIKHIATERGESVEATKDFITRSLLIDASMQCCSPTTRVTQAIEALQILLWGIHNQIIIDEPGIEQLSIEAPDFEEEWKWLGSYATWRAAMFVQLYPENILIPSLKPVQSEAFKTGLRKLNNIKNKQGASQIYTEYFEYIDDIKDADILANCRTSSPGKLTDYDGESYYNKKVYFSFSRGKRTKSYYYRETHILNSDSSISNQSEWVRIPLEVKGDFVGVQSCDIGGEYIIYFFTKEDNELMLSIYNYKTNKWGENKAVEFESLQGNVELSLEYKYFFIDMQYDPRKRPFVFVYGYNWHKLNNVDDYNQLSDRTDFTFEGFIMNKKGTADNVLYNADRFFVGKKGGLGGSDSKSYKLADRELKEEYKNVVPKYIYYEGVNWEDFESEQSYKGDYSAGALVVIGYDQGKKKFCKMKFFWWDIKKIRILWSREYNSINFDSVVPKLFSYNNKIRNAIIDNQGKNAYVIDDSFGQEGIRLYEEEPNIFVTDDPIIYSSTIKFNLGFYLANQIAVDFYITNIGENGNPGEEILLFDKYYTNEGISRYAIDATYNINFLSRTDILDIPLTNEYNFDDGKVKVYIDQLKTLFSGFSLEDKIRAKNYFTLMHEGFYYLPLSVANQLTKLNEFEEAKKYLAIIYDFKENQPIYFGFRQADNKIAINNEWGNNPLNPHDVAASRPGTLKKSFYIQLINYFLAFANYEFTQDTVESIARAKQLYLEARDLVKDLKGVETNCNSQIANFEITINSDYIREYWVRIKTYLYRIESKNDIESLLNDISTTWEGAGTEKAKMQQIESDILAVVNSQTSGTMSEELAAIEKRIVRATNLIVAPTKNTKENNAMVISAGNNFSNAVLETTGFLESTIKTQAINFPFLEINSAPMPVQEGREEFFQEILTKDLVNKAPGDGYAVQAQVKPERILKLNFKKKVFGALAPFKFCIAPNPIIEAYELQVQLNLYKIRNCMNIAGIQRSLEPFAAPTNTTSGVPMIGVGGLISSGGMPIPQASPYRFGFIIERSKELINIGQQIENALLSALEKLDDENYNVLRAKQDLETAKANIKLQDLRINEAEDGIKLAELQTERAQIQVEGLQGMIDAGLNEYEQKIIDNIFAIQDLNVIIEALDFYSNIISTGSNLIIGATSTNLPAITAGVYSLYVLGSVRKIFSNLRGGLQAQSSAYQIYAGQILREQEWNYQKTIASHDVKLGQQQEKLAQDRLRIVNQEKVIAELQTEQSEATIDYLINQQFTNAALYNYMTEVLEKVYSYFLQEATAMAKLARNQLAFERQQNIPQFIKGDYWIPDTESSSISSQNGETQDRKGITGSSRLLEDIIRLEQFANQTDQRKQQLFKTISLATLAPFEFQQFKESGLITFATDMKLFDMDFPGHYLRLIKKVSVSVIALVPPVDGIKATFSGLGLSRVVTGGPLYQTQDIRRTPESISLSSPTSSTGMFELNPDNKLLKPFEGSGVESFWEFRMEKAANPNVDYNAIADILVTIEYEALNSFDYRAQVVKRLNEEASYEAMLPISFKSNLPDQWFDIVNPDQAEIPFSVSFDLDKYSFPVNVKDPIITNVLLYFPQKGESYKEISIANFTFAEKGSETDLGGTGIITNEARISTADANGNVLSSILGISVEGRWKLTLTDSPQLRQLIDEEKLTDILLVITFAGETPKYNL